MIKPRPMMEAPKDGTRILVQTKIFLYERPEPRNNYSGGYKPRGDYWVEARHIGGRWEVWCGNAKTRSSDRLHPIAWCERPGASAEIEESTDQLWNEPVCTCQPEGHWPALTTAERCAVHAKPCAAIGCTSARVDDHLFCAKHTRASSRGLSLSPSFDVDLIRQVIQGDYP